jgi:hypothetical protein
MRKNYRWTFNGTWSTNELKAVYQVALRTDSLTLGAGFSKQMFGPVVFDKAAMGKGGLGEAHHITLNENFSKYSQNDQVWDIAHELGHAWDGASGWNLSKELQEDVHSIYPSRISKDEWDYGSSGNGPGATGWPDSSWGDRDPTSRWNAKEDFAQSFAAYIYIVPAADKLRVNYHQTYGSGYNSYYDTPRGQYITEQIRGYWNSY